MVVVVRFALIVRYFIVFYRSKISQSVQSPKFHVRPKNYSNQSVAFERSRAILSAMYQFAGKTTNVHVIAENKRKISKISGNVDERGNARHNAEEIEFPCYFKTNLSFHSFNDVGSCRHRLHLLKTPVQNT